MTRNYTYNSASRPIVPLRKKRRDTLSSVEMSISNDEGTQSEDENMVAKAPSSLSDSFLGETKPEELEPVTKNIVYNPPDAIGLSDKSVSTQKRKLLNLVDKLHAVGVQADIDIPQIVVVGQQSAGKSSLIEAISGIRFPRASGTCTRCPTECRLKRTNGSWVCRISLRFVVDEDGDLLGTPKNIPFGPDITDIDEVEQRLTRATRAILNPSVSPRDILNGHVPKSPELTFSRNYISVSVEGPNVEDLSFCDLPGLIASISKGGNIGDKKMIEDSIVSYIEKPSCLILLTVACETDFETQGAYSLATEYDPQGKRTIGVLTKPDRIAVGDENKWAKFVMDEEEELELGWYCVKQPNTNELNEGITWAKARANEKEFFETVAPWSTLPINARKRLGTRCLVEQLSNTLARLIAKRLPALQSELETLHVEAQNSLHGLPKPLSTDPFVEMINILSEFSKDVTRHVEGMPDDDGLVQKIRTEQERLKRAIRSLAPEFKPYKSSHGPQALPPMGFLSNEDVEGQEQPEEAADVLMLHLDEIMERAVKARTRELPDNYPFVVKQQLIEEIVRQWREPVFKFFERIIEIVSQFTKSLVREHFERFEHGGLLSTVQMTMQEQILKRQEEARQHLEWLLRLESRPFTTNTHYLSDYKEKFLTYYKGWRLKNDNETIMDNIQKSKYAAKNNPGPFFFGGLKEKEELPSSSPSVNNVLAELSALGFIGVKPEDLAKLLPTDPYDTALEIMATVRAYFQVSYKRFVDNVPLAVDHDFVLGLSEDLNATLLRAVLSGDDQHKRCGEYLKESPQIAARRELLQRKFERLSAAKAELLAVW